LASIEKTKSKPGKAITNSRPWLTDKLNMILHKQIIHQEKEFNKHVVYGSAMPDLQLPSQLKGITACNWYQIILLL